MGEDLVVPPRRGSGGGARPESRVDRNIPYRKLCAWTGEQLPVGCTRRRKFSTARARRQAHTFRLWVANAKLHEWWPDDRRCPQLSLYIGGSLVEVVRGTLVRFEDAHPRAPWCVAGRVFLAASVGSAASRLALGAFVGSLFIGNDREGTAARHSRFMARRWWFRRVLIEVLS